MLLVVIMVVTPIYLKDSIEAYPYSEEFHFDNIIKFLSHLKCSVNLCISILSNIIGWLRGLYSME